MPTVWYVAHLDSGQLFCTNVTCLVNFWGPSCILFRLLPTLHRANLSAQARHFRRLWGPKLPIVWFVAHLVSRANFSAQARRFRQFMWPNLHTFLLPTLPRANFSSQARHFRQFLGPIWGPSCLLSRRMPTLSRANCFAQARRFRQCQGLSCDSNGDSAIERWR